MQKSLIIRSLLFFSCLSVCFSLVKAQGNIKAEKTQSIEGTVTDFRGVPWKDVSIRLKSRKETYSDSNTQIEREVKTDSNGNYSFKDLPDDGYDVTLLRVVKKDTLEETRQTPILFDGKPYRVDFGIEVGAFDDCPNYTVYGVVRNEKGKALKGAKISIINAFNQRRIDSSITDEQGFYRVNICNGGQYILFANTPNYKIKSKDLLFTPKDIFKNVDFVLSSFPQYTDPYLRQ